MNMSWLSILVLNFILFASGSGFALVEDYNKSDLKNCVMSVCYKVDGSRFVPVSTNDNPELIKKCLTQQSTTQTRWWVADVQVSSHSEALEFFKAQFESPDYSFEEVINGPISCRSFEGIVPFQKVEPSSYGVNVDVQVVEEPIETRSGSNTYQVVELFGENECSNPVQRIGPLDTCEVINSPRNRVTSIKVGGECLEIGHQTAEYACNKFRNGVPPENSFIVYHRSQCIGPTYYKTRSQTCTSMSEETRESLKFWEGDSGELFVRSYRDYNGICHDLSQYLSPEEACRVHGE